MEKPHTSTRTTTSATDFSDVYKNRLDSIEVILYGGPPDIYVECEVKDVEEVTRIEWKDSHDLPSVE